MPSGLHPPDAPDEPGFAEAEQLYMDPEECIDCDACVEACPVDAITSETRSRRSGSSTSPRTPPTTRRTSHEQAKILNTSAASLADDTGDGMLMFFVFVFVFAAAVLASTGAVALIALVATWWMLGFGFAIDVIMTALVVLTILHVMAGRAHATASAIDPRLHPSVVPKHAPDR